MNQRIGENIAKLRKANNMSQNDLAKKLNVSNKTISKWECNKAIPDIDILNHIANIFNISLDELTNTDIDLKKSTTVGDGKKSFFDFFKIKKVWISTLVSILSLIMVIVLCITLIPRDQNIYVKSSQLFQVDNDKKSLTCSVSNDTTNISLINSINISDNLQWSLYSDINGNNEIISKNVELEIGNNIFYILIKDNNENIEYYTVTIRRKPIYTVTFNTNGGTIIQSVEVQEDDKLTNIDIPTKEGFVFSCWHYNSQEFDLNNRKVTSSLTLDAIWIPNSYIVTLDSNGGVCSSTTKQVLYNKSFNLGVATKEHYDFLGWEYNGNLITNDLGVGLSNWSIISNNITVVAKFKISTYSVSLQFMVNNEIVENVGQLQGSGVFNYGTGQTITAIVYPGYDWIGWFEGENKIADSSSFNYVIVDEDKLFTAKLQEKSEMSMFKFSSSMYGCSVDGFKSTMDKSTVTELVFPEYVTHISAFDNESSYWPNVTSISVSHNNKNYSSVNNCLLSKDGKTLYMGCKNSVIPNTVETIGYLAFLGCSNLTEITIPNSVKYIKRGAFGDCSSLVNIVIPDSVKNVEGAILYGCSSLTNLTIPFIGGTNRDLYGSILDDIVDVLNFEHIFGEYSDIPVSLKNVIVTGGKEFTSNSFKWCKNIENLYVRNLTLYEFLWVEDYFGGLLENKTSIYVLKSIVDSEATNDFLNNSSIFKKEESEEYYKYTYLL